MSAEDSPDRRRDGGLGGAHAVRDRVGLCRTCRHGMLVKSTRGATFYRCGLSDHDPAFARYPPLPVDKCTGYDALP